MIGDSSLLEAVRKQFWFLVIRKYAGRRVSVGTSHLISFICPSRIPPSKKRADERTYCIFQHINKKGNLVASRKHHAVPTA